MKKYLLVSLFALLATISLPAKNFLFVGAYENGVMPDYVYRPPKPLMWNAKLKVSRAALAGFEHRFFSHKKWLELYTGVSTSYMECSNITNDDNIFALSSYLLMRLYLVKSDILDFYISYSPAGPSVLSKNTFGPTAFSNQFVFQNQIGLGVTLGKGAETELFVKLYHYSNGDLFPINGGIDIPILVGFSFVL